MTFRNAYRTTCIGTAFDIFVLYRKRCQVTAEWREILLSDGYLNYRAPNVCVCIYIFRVLVGDVNSRPNTRCTVYAVNQSLAVIGTVALPRVGYRGPDGVRFVLFLPLPPPVHGTLIDVRVTNVDYTRADNCPRNIIDRFRRPAGCWFGSVPGRPINERTQRA